MRVRRQDVRKMIIVVGEEFEETIAWIYLAIGMVCLSCLLATFDRRQLKSIVYLLIYAILNNLIIFFSLIWCCVIQLFVFILLFHRKEKP